MRLHSLCACTFKYEDKLLLSHFLFLRCAITQILADINKLIRIFML